MPRSSLPPSLPVLPSSPACVRPVLTGPTAGSLGTTTTITHSHIITPTEPARPLKNTLDSTRWTAGKHHLEENTVQSSESLLGPSMAATLSGAYTSAPDTPSPVFPDRLIRPLPKRPLRSRLSSDAADTILYPPAQPTTQLFYGAYLASGDSLNDHKVYVQRNVYGYEHSVDGDEPDHHYHLDPHHEHPEHDHPDHEHEQQQQHQLENENEHHVYEDPAQESGEDEGAAVRRSLGSQRASADGPKLATPASTGGAQDGYDAFENTNNKKKRKIPTSGGLGCHSSLSSDLASLSCSGGSGASVSIDDGGGSGSYYSGNPASPVTAGMSAKGRYGRNGSGRGATARTPLANHSPNTWSTGRRHDTALAQENLEPGKDRGIISAAIANAAAALSSATPQGQKSVSLLDQTKRPAPAKTQFTFTCESDSSKGMAWQSAAYPYSLPDHHRSVAQPPPLPGQRFSTTTGTQTSPSMVSQAGQQQQLARQQHHQQQQQQHHQQQQQQSSQPPAPPPRKPRRSSRAVYAHAARQRRIQQQYTNLHHPPDLESIWICEFCEYESIFGHPPEALIRQYEIKDRKERRRLAEKRRLLEKAKMKGRKGKKGSKHARQNAPSVSAHSPGSLRMHTPPEDEDDDDYVHECLDDVDFAPRIPPSVSRPQRHPSPPGLMDRAGGQPGRASAGGGGGGGGGGVGVGGGHGRTG